MIRKYNLWFVALLLMPLILTGCAGEKAAKKDPFFEKWETMAETSSGHSPAPRKRIIITQEEGAPQQESSRAVDGMAAGEKLLPSTNVNLKMRQTEIKTALRALARLADQNILFKSDLKGEMTIDINDVPWGQAFNSILRTNSLTYMWEGDILRVMTVEDMESDLKLSAIKEKRKVLNIDTRRVDPLVTTVVSVDYADPKSMRENLQEVLTKDKDGKTIGSIRIDEHNNSLIIQAIKDDLDKMVPIIEKIDKPTSQIVIKANIVETTKDTARNLGVQWGGIYGTKAGGQNLWVAPGGSTAAGAAPADPVGGGYTPTIPPKGLSGQGFGVNFPTTVKSDTGAASLGLLFGNIGGNILEAQLTALQKDGKLNILSSPSITTLDNQKAFTENGEKVPFVTTETSSGSTTRTVKFENAVLRLEITPHVIDGKNLKMKILVQKDEVDMTRQVDGNPFILKKHTETNLIVQDGETIVISGLTKHRKTDSSSGVPILKDIPIIGWLFKGYSKSESMEEVLIFITPHILPPQVST